MMEPSYIRGWDKWKGRDKGGSILHQVDLQRTSVVSLNGSECKRDLHCAPNGETHSVSVPKQMNR